MEANLKAFFILEALWLHDTKTHVFFRFESYEKPDTYDF